jgi:hypothetical protein
VRVQDLRSGSKTTGEESEREAIALVSVYRAFAQLEQIEQIDGEVAEATESY